MGTQPLHRAPGPGGPDQHPEDGVSKTGCQETGGGGGLQAPHPRDMKALSGTPKQSLGHIATQESLSMGLGEATASEGPSR